MEFEVKKYNSHGDGEIDRTKFKFLGENVIFEKGVLVFHSENINLGNNIYIGHYSILKGYYKNDMTIGRNTWIGQYCFFHSAGGIEIGENVGIGPYVKILTSVHMEEGRDKPIVFSELDFKKVVIEKNCDLGVGTVILPGVTIGEGSQIGAGSVVSKDIPPYSIAAGVPAKVLRMRNE